MILLCCGFNLQQLKNIVEHCRCLEILSHDQNFPPILENYNEFEIACILLYFPRLLQYTIQCMTWALHHHTSLVYDDKILKHQITRLIMSQYLHTKSLVQLHHHTYTCQIYGFNDVKIFIHGITGLITSQYLHTLGVLCTGCCGGAEDGLLVTMVLVVDGNTVAMGLDLTDGLEEMVVRFLAEGRAFGKRKHAISQVVV